MAILVAIGRRPQARLVVETAYDLATAYNDELVALHVIPQEDVDEHEEHIMGLPFYDSFNFSNDEEGAIRFGMEVIDAVVPEGDSEAVAAHGRTGNVVDEILAEADELDPRYIVIGGRHRSPVGKAAFGDKTQKILLNSDKPVVTIMSE